MPRAKKNAVPAHLEVLGVDPVSEHHAKDALAQFRSAKARALKVVAEERSTKRDALKSLRGVYERLCGEYLRAAPATTYAAWCDLVKPEWDELVAAAADDAIWDRLVDTYQERAHAE